MYDDRVFDPVEVIVSSITSVFLVLMTCVIVSEREVVVKSMCEI